MTSTARPRHPWKALAAVFVTLVVAHTARATVSSHDHGFTHVRIVDGSASRGHCPSIVIDDDHDPDDDPVIHDDDDDWN